jgi:hypothetical protein
MWLQFLRSIPDEQCLLPFATAFRQHLNPLSVLCRAKIAQAENFKNGKGLRENNE